MIRVGIAVLLMSCVLAACVGSGRRAEPDLHTIHFRVHPDSAVVSVGSPQRVVVAMISQPGPAASFDLPEGHYIYNVAADGYATFEGSFQIPKNQNLEVWLKPH